MKRHLCATIAIVAMTGVVRAADDDPLAVTARLDGLDTLVVDLEPADGWSMAAAGIPQAIIQIGPPASVTLDGDVLRGRRALSRNEFLMAPYERPAEPGETRIDISVADTRDADERIAVNVIAYMRRGEKGPARFVRKRLELPVTPDATGAPAASPDSHWGDERAGLQVGDRAASFSWPKADGTTVSLEDHLGERNILLTTYRAYW